MIRVLNIISDTNIGGAGRVLINYLQYADRAQFDTAVALPRGSLLKAPLEELNTTVYEVDGIADRSYDKGDVKLLQELIARVDPSIPTGPCPAASPPGGAGKRWCIPAIPPSRCPPSCGIPLGGG